MENSPTKANRKVRFSLPESHSPAVQSVQMKHRMSHGTKQYINGTLVTQPQISVMPSEEPTSRVSSSVNNKASQKVVLHLRPSSSYDKIESIEILPKSGTSENQSKKMVVKKMNRGEGRQFRSLPQIHQKFPSNEDLSSISKTKLIPDLTLPTTTNSDTNNNLQQKDSKRSTLLKGLSPNPQIPLTSNSSNSKIIRAKTGNSNGASVSNGPKVVSKNGSRPMISANLQNSQTKVGNFQNSVDQNGTNKSDTCNNSFINNGKENGTNCDINVNVSLKSKPIGNLLTVPNLNDRFNDDIFVNDGFDEDLLVPKTNEHANQLANSVEFWDFVERWRAHRLLKKSESILNIQVVNPTTKSESKSPTLTSRLKALRMSLEQVPNVTTLLRASRDANEYLLKEVFRDILENGISKENLNATDKSGRTAISYICSTNLTNFLELFLQLPGIDVNKADNEGNTPLHFASQAGLSDVVNMLITKCRSLVIDSKNNLGFTPLMKAALQGRTKCAKLLLFAGASPTETDSGRGFRAEQWARFCGRHTCAETIEQCARSKLLDKSTSAKWSHDSLVLDKNLVKSRSNSGALQNGQSGGLKSKFRKVFPFHFSKDKNVAKEEDNYTSELVNYLKTATLCVSGPALSANKKIIQSLIRPLEVPKLEVTYANNNSIIKKYEANNGESDTIADEKSTPPQQSPVPPSRGKIKNK